jgi:hypothetical protein
MKKTRKIMAGLAALAMALGFAACPTEPEEEGSKDPYAEYYKDKTPNGSTAVINSTSYDMLLFTGEKLSEISIIGGVRAHNRRNLDFSGESNYQVGGYKLLWAIRQSEYEANKTQSKVDYTVMVTYGEGRRYSATIVSTTDGQYVYEVYNRSKDYGLELRMNAPDGDTVAYLSKGEVRRILHASNTTEFTLYPVWVAFNNQTKTIVSFCPSDDPLGPRDIQPKRETEERAPYYFPMGGASVNITFPNVTLPFATIFVRNNTGMNANFRIAELVKEAESKYTGITSGSRESYEIESTGEGLDLNLAMSQGNIVVKVRKQDDPNAQTVTIDNGFVYNVSLNLKTGENPALATSYEAWLVKGDAISKNDLLTN